MTEFEKWENKLSDVCEEHYADCMKCPVKEGCDKYTSKEMSEADNAFKLDVLKELFS